MTNRPLLVICFGIGLFSGHLLEDSPVAYMAVCLTLVVVSVALLMQSVRQSAASFETDHLEDEW